MTFTRLICTTQLDIHAEPSFSPAGHGFRDKKKRVWVNISFSKIIYYIQIMKEKNSSVYVSTLLKISVKNTEKKKWYSSVNLH